MDLAVPETVANPHPEQPDGVARSALLVREELHGVRLFLECVRTHLRSHLQILSPKALQPIAFRGGNRTESRT